MKYLVAQGCEWKNSSQVAAKFGHVNVLRFADEHGFTVSADLCAWAAAHGQLNILRYLHETKHYHLDTYVLLQASIAGQVECLRYIHKSGAEWHANACLEATLYGHLECLK